jgi:hypothetical protein
VSPAPRHRDHNGSAESPLVYSDAFGLVSVTISPDELLALTRHLAAGIDSRIAVRAVTSAGNDANRADRLRPAPALDDPLGRDRTRDARRELR